MPSWVKEKHLLSIFLFFFVFLIFTGVLGNTFIIYDDSAYVTENAHILGGITWKGFLWAFTSYSNANWHPLTWISHMFDIQIYGLNPTGHHLTSLLFHVINTTLLFIVFHKMSGALWQSFFTALLFGIHPLHVESVAWIAERKDVLSGFFFIITLWAYARYVQSPAVGRYWWIVVFFVFGLMAKPMLVTLPLILLLLDYWPLQRIVSCSFASEGHPQQFTFSTLVCEKIPLFILAIISGLITYFGQLGGGATPFPGKSVYIDNISNGMLSYVRYIEKLLWPQNLAVFYPRTDVSTMQLASASLVILFFTGIAVIQRKKRPFLFVGWFWFICTLTPVIGFVRIGSSAMSDRYTYIPSIGFFMLISWLISAVIINTKIARLSLGMLFVVISTCTLLTVKQVAYWKNSFTLFEHALQVTDANWLAHNNLAAAHLLWANNDDSLNLTKYLCSKNGCENTEATRLYSLNKAIDELTAAIQIDPNYVSAYINLGLAYYEIGNRQAAEIIVEKLKYIDPLSSERLRKSGLDRH